MKIVCNTAESHFSAISAYYCWQNCRLHWLF